MHQQTFYTWLKFWLTTYKRYSLRPSTFERYERSAEKFSDGDFPLAALSCEYLQGKVNSLYLEGLSTSSIKQVVCVAREAIRKAVLLGYLPAGYAAFCDLLEIPKRKPKEIKALTPFEVRRILETSETWKPYGELFIFLLKTGARIGEALALEWSDIDFDRSTISITKTDDRGELRDDVKTITSRRVIPVGSDVVQLLAVRRSGAVDRWIFNRAATGRGRADYRGVLRDWHKLLDALGFERCGLHVLRHTYASQALRCGVNAVTLAALLGHSDSSFTLRRYCDADFSDLRDAARVFSYRKEGIGNG